MTDVAYCLRADSGELVWKFRPRPAGRLILNNGRFIPTAPVRSGVTVDDGVAYFAASLLPWRRSFLCAVDADTGNAEGERLFVKELDNTTFEGPLAVSPRLLIAPQGRVPPLLFSRRSGRQLGALDGGGGSFVVVLPDRNIVHGPGPKAGWVTVSNSTSREKLATHDNALALVLDDQRTYLLTNSTIGAIDTETKDRAWHTPCKDGLELIGVGNVLFVGRPGHVEAYSAAEGTLLWSAQVEGKAYGLSFADNRLLVSTDAGAIYAFAPTSSDSAAPESPTPIAPPGPPPIDESRLTPIQQQQDNGLVGRWVFQPPHLRDSEAANLAGGSPLSISGDVELAEAGQYAALALAGGQTGLTIADDLKTAKLPAAELTAAAWVRVDKPQPWGGIVGAIQDNGQDESGWILGYRGSSFCLGLASRGGGGRITYLTSSQPWDRGAWHHVVGTYDGQTMRLFVDGRLAATSTAQGGPIRYARARGRR